MAAGGGPRDITGVGDTRNNSVIGGQATRVGNEILGMSGDVTCIVCRLNVIPAKVKK